MHDVPCIRAESDNIVYVEIPSVQPFLFVFRLYRTADHGTVDTVIVVITPVQVDFQTLVARHVRIFPDRKLFHFDHCTRQHRLIPVFRVHQSRLYSDIVQWSQIVPSFHVAVENVISDKTVQRIFTMFQSFEAMIFGIFIFRIHRIVYLASLIVESFYISGHNTIFP